MLCHSVKAVLDDAVVASATTACEMFVHDMYLILPAFASVQNVSGLHSNPEPQTQECMDQQ